MAAERNTMRKVRFIYFPIDIPLVILDCKTGKVPYFLFLVVPGWTNLTA